MTPSVLVDGSTGRRHHTVGKAQVAKMCHVYVLRNQAGRLYIGQTANLEARVTQHQRDEAGWTRGRGPWELVHSEQFSTRVEAVRRERYLKSGLGRGWLEQTVLGP
jgi:putative endonuclease